MEPSPKPPGRVERQTLPETQPGPLYGMGGNGPPISMMRPNSCNIFATHQHDAAEFLQHLCQKTDCTALRGGWEARRHRGGAYEILDEQFTCPHIRLILERPFHLQDAVDKWHQQECVHAFTRPPDTLILQVGRFLQTERGIRKTRQSFQLQKKVRIPIFTDHSGTISAHRL